MRDAKLLLQEPFAEQHEECFHLLLSVILQLSSWRELVEVEDRMEVLHRFLIVLASRVERCSEMTLDAAVRGAYDYVAGLIEACFTPRLLIAVLQLLSTFAAHARGCYSCTFSQYPCIL